MRWTIGLLAGMLLGALVSANSAEGAFPGQRGKIAYVREELGETRAVYTAYLGGPGTRLTSGAAFAPAWSPDGTKIAFRAGPGIHVINQDGTGLTGALAAGTRPAWSPDGAKIVYESEGSVHVMNADGSNQTLLRAGSDPSWSPDGSKIAFVVATGLSADIWTMNPDGTGAVQLTAHDLPNDARFLFPDWSPDGTKIAFSNCQFNCENNDRRELHLINADGTGHRVLTDGGGLKQPAWSPDGLELLAASDDAGSGGFPGLYVVSAGTGAVAVERLPYAGVMPSWQPVAGLPGYPRPRGATPLRVALVPAFRGCIDPNRMHGEPLAFDSCSPPVQESAHLTIGTPEANGRAVRSIGFFEAKAMVGNPSAPQDDADVAYSFDMTDVWQSDAVDDYAGELRVTAPLRISDKNNEGGVGATMSDTSISLAVPCAQTADPALGSACSLTTTADTLAPGTIVEDARAVWALGSVRVFDGGPDGSAATPAGETLFAVQGVFAP